MDLKTILYSATVNVFQSKSPWLLAYALTFIFAGFLWFENSSRRQFNQLALSLPGPQSYPLIGSMHHFIGSSKHVMDSILKISSIYGPNPFKLWLGRSLSVVLMKSNDLQIVLNSPNALEKGLFDKLFRYAIGEGLICAPVHKWKKNRRLITPMFNTSSLKQFVRVFNEKNQILIKILSKEVGNPQPFDLLKYIEPTNLDIICKCAMGYDSKATSSCRKSSFISALSQVTTITTLRVCRPWLYPNIIYSMYLKLTGKYKVFDTMNTLPIQIIKEKKRVMKQSIQISNTSALDVIQENNNKSLKIFLDTLLEINETGTDLSDEEIKDEVLTMMAAGSETGAVTLCFCLLLLAMNPKVQDKVYDEIYEVLGDGDELITIEDANKLVYLDQVLKETLRLYPTVPIIFRKLQDDVTIDSENHTLPKGTMCILSILNIHHSAEEYPNPLSFNPENFSQENIERRHKYSFIPFGGGPRGCLGSKFAMLSMKVVVSTFLRNFSVHTNIKQNDIKLKLEVVIKSVDGYPVTIQPRDRRSSCMRN